MKTRSRDAGLQPANDRRPGRRRRFQPASGLLSRRIGFREADAPPAAWLGPPTGAMLSVWTLWIGGWMQSRRLPAFLQTERGRRTDASGQGRRKATATPAGWGRARSPLGLSVPGCCWRWWLVGIHETHTPDQCRPGSITASCPRPWRDLHKLQGRAPGNDLWGAAARTNALDCVAMPTCCQASRMAANPYGST